MLQIGALCRAWQDLPQTNRETLLRGRVPVILAPHPSDGVMGCGGLIAQCVAAGVIPEVVIMTDGSHCHPQSKEYPPERLRLMREEETLRSLGLLGLPQGRSWFLGHEDCEGLPIVGPKFDLAARRLAGICHTHCCTLLIAPWPADGHADHAATALLAEHVALREGLDLLYYPLDSWSLPDETLVDAALTAGWQLDISGETAIKHAAVMAHQSQYGDLFTDESGAAPCAKKLAACRRPVEIYLEP